MQSVCVYVFLYICLCVCLCEKSLHLIVIIPPPPPPPPILGTNLHHWLEFYFDDFWQAVYYPLVSIVDISVVAFVESTKPVYLWKGLNYRSCKGLKDSESELLRLKIRSCKAHNYSFHQGENSVRIISI